MINDNFNAILNLIPIDTDVIDWNALYKTELGAFFGLLENTMQDEEYHAEGNVLNHTKFVCENLIKLPEYKNSTKNDKIIMFLAALLHDVGKIYRTKVEDGRIVSKGHTLTGCLKAREFMWKNLGLSGSAEKQNLRESVCFLIRYHSFPPYAMTEKNSVTKALKISSNGKLCEGFSSKKLYALEKADVLGRISNSRDEMLEKIEYYKILCQDLNCYEKPYEFSSEYTKRAFFLGKTQWHFDNLYKNSWGEVVLMSGLPGTGKDTFINKYYSNLPVISLDEIRKKLKILPTDNQSEVIALAHENAKEYLRKKQPFVWNATSLSNQIRTKQISLFETYNASVKTIFLETEWNEQLSRNKNREAVVPQPVVEKMLSRLETPESYECETVEWLIT